MKLGKNFVTQDFNGVTMLIGMGESDFNGIVKCNKTTAYIIELLREDVTRDDIVRKMLERYDASEQLVCEDVDSVLASLRSINAIDE